MGESTIPAFLVVLGCGSNPGWGWAVVPILQFLMVLGCDPNSWWCWAVIPILQFLMVLGCDPNPGRFWAALWTRRLLKAAQGEAGEAVDQVPWCRRLNRKGLSV